MWAESIPFYVSLWPLVFPLLFRCLSVTWQELLDAQQRAERAERYRDLGNRGLQPQRAVPAGRSWSWRHSFASFRSHAPIIVKKAFQECSLHSAAFLQRSGPVLQAHSVLRVEGTTFVMSGATGPKCECALQPSWSLTASRLQNFETRGQAPKQPRGRLAPRQPF